MKLCQKCQDAIKQVLNDNMPPPDGEYHEGVYGGGDFVYDQSEAVPEEECEFGTHRTLNLFYALVHNELDRMDEKRKADAEFWKGNLMARIDKSNNCFHQHKDLSLDKCLDCGETREFQLWAWNQVNKK